MTAKIEQRLMFTSRKDAFSYFKVTLLMEQMRKTHTLANSV